MQGKNDRRVGIERRGDILLIELSGLGIYGLLTVENIV